MVPVSTCVLWVAVMLLYMIANPRLDCNTGATSSEIKFMGDIRFYNDCDHGAKRWVRDGK